VTSTTPALASTKRKPSRLRAKLVRRSPRSTDSSRTQIPVRPRSVRPDTNALNDVAVV
jgi:hypothetical protein